MSQETSAKPDATAKPYSEAESSSEQVGKVAEGVATYAYTPLKKAASEQHQIAGISVSKEVWRFAVTNDLIPCLETAERLIRELFPKVLGIQLTYEIDPEIENESYIIIRAKVQGEFEELLRSDWAYTKKITRLVPINKLPLFSLFPGNEADYNMKSNEFQSQAICALRVAKAEAAIGLLVDCSKEPWRSQIRTGIREYERKTGLHL